MEILFVSIIVVLLISLMFLMHRNTETVKEKDQLIQAGKTALDIADRVVSTNDLGDLYQYILKACEKLIPQARIGMILMFDSEGFLALKAAIGVNLGENDQYRLKLEDTSLYKATNGKFDRTVIIDHIEDIIPAKVISLPGSGELAIRSEIAAPLKIGDELAGMLLVDSDKSGVFTKQDVSVLEYMSNQLRIVINNQRLYGDIQRLSHYDSLTGLLNRESFEKETLKLLNDPSKDFDSLFFVIMNIDNLKHVNQMFGHSYGDDLIKDFSEIIKKHLSKNAICSRYSGDEFSAVIQGDRFNIAYVIEEIKKEFQDHKIRPLDSDFHPGFCYGMVSFRDGNCNLEELDRRTDSLVNEDKVKTKKEKDKRKDHNGR